MADPDSIPTSYHQWRECMTIRCGIPLTAAYIETWLHKLQDTAHPRTLEFVRKYGEAYTYQIISWFELAAREATP
jgi:hypothetical protein